MLRFVFVLSMSATLWAQIHTSGGAQVEAYTSLEDESTKELLVAAASGDIASVRRLLLSGVDPINALKWAMENLDALGEENAQHLAWALHTGTVTETLLAGGADPNGVINPDGATVLMFTAFIGHFKSVELLLAAQANPNAQDAHGETALTLVLGPMAQVRRVNQKRIVRALLRGGADPNLANNKGERPLTLVVGSGRMALVYPLIDSGADVTLESPQVQVRVTRWVLGRELSDAVVHRDVARVETLLGQGADPNGLGEVNAYGIRRPHPPLMMATLYNDYKTMAVLLIGGADPNLRAGGEQESALLWAVMGDDLPGAKLLLAGGADPDPTDIRGSTPLMFLANRSEVPMEIFRELVLEGADLNHKDLVQRTVLMIAARRGHYGVVRILLQRGADPNLKRELALMKPLVLGGVITPEILENWEPSDALKQADGKTAAMIAADAGHREIADLIEGWANNPN